MLNLCKNVKIYHTVNHYHQNSAPKEQAEVHFQEAPRPRDLSPSSQPHIRMVESHSMSPKKSRAGINISLKESSIAPYKHSLRTQDQDLTHTRNIHSSTNSNGHSSQPHSQKIKTFGKFDRCSPLIVESKYTREENTPCAANNQNPEKRLSEPEPYSPRLPQMPLKRGITGTTQLSNHSNQPKIVVTPPNPLKKSTTFLRSSSRSSIDKSLKNSVEISLGNSIDFKFSNYKLKREDASESLLRLSCSSYSQILDKAPHHNEYSDFSHSCSLELKRQESFFLNEYACDVDQSIIISRPAQEKSLKIVKSNYDLLGKEDCSQELKQNQSNILEGQVDSPVKKMKKRYGSNLLHPNDKQTVVSKSFYSKSHDNSHLREIIDESIIIEHEIDNKFTPIKNREINKPEYRMFLAIESSAKLLVNIKQFPISHIERINQELSIYRQIESHNIDANISKLYQMFTNGNIFVLVKEPYELTLQEFITKHSQQYVQISWQFITRSIEESLLKTISAMQKQGMYLNRLISAQDMVHEFGEWKLHSPDAFECGERGSVEVSQVLAHLRQQIQGGLTRNNHFSM